MSVLQNLTYLLGGPRW